MDPEKLQRAFRKPKGTISSFRQHFCTLYTTIPHDKLKSKLKEIINQCFFHKNGNLWFQYVVIGYKDTYFVWNHSDASQKYSGADVIKMLEYLIGNIFVEFCGWIYQQTVGIPMDNNCAPLLADLFLYSFETEFVQSLLQAGKRHLAQQFNFTYRYIDDVFVKHKVCRVFRIHLSTWTWNKGNNGDCSLLILGLLSLHWQWKAYY